MSVPNFFADLSAARYEALRNNPELLYRFRFGREGERPLTLRHALRLAKRQEAVNEAQDAWTTDLGANVRLFDSWQTMEVEPSSVRLCLVDPPYGSPDTNLAWGWNTDFESLGQWCSEKLTEDGFLVCFLSRLKLLEELEALGKHLFYHWTTVVVNTHGKCDYIVGIFTKNPQKRKTFFRDCIVVHEPINRHQHKCQKPLSACLEFVERYSDPGDLVCDMYMGSGTSGVAAVEKGRKFVGAEICPDKMTIAKSRISCVSKNDTTHDKSITMCEEATA